MYENLMKLLKAKHSYINFEFLEMLNPESLVEKIT